MRHSWLTSATKSSSESSTGPSEASGSSCVQAGGSSGTAHGRSVANGPSCAHRARNSAYGESVGLRSSASSRGSAATRLPNRALLSRMASRSSMREDGVPACLTRKAALLRICAASACARWRSAWSGGRSSSGGT